MSILCYHEVDPTWVSPLAIHPEAFERQCRWLATRTILSLDDAAPLAARRGHLPHGTSSITFDDGLPGVHAHAWPALRRHGLSATVFVVARSVLGHTEVDWVDGLAAGVRHAMTRDQVAELAEQGMTIGSHSFAHHDLTTLGEAACVEDLRRSREALEDLIGKPVRHLAYPRGRHDAVVRRATERAGFDWAHALPESTDVGGRWAVPRVGVYPANGLPGLRIKSHPWYAAVRTSQAGPVARDAMRLLRRSALALTGRPGPPRRSTPPPDSTPPAS